MMQGAFYTRMALIATICAALSGATYFFMYQLFSIHRYATSLDPLLSPETHTALITHIEKIPIKADVTKKQRVQKILSEFPYVESVVLTLIAPGILHYEIAAAQPLIVLNNEYVLTNTARVFPMHIFSSHSVKLLPTMQVKKLENMSESELHALVDVAHNIRSLLAWHYTITCLDQFRFHFIDKKDPSFSILADAHSIPTRELLQRCMRCKQKITQEPSKHKKVPTRWVADVRFNNQIIFYQEREGVFHA
jgi:hypothetical protein